MISPVHFLMCNVLLSILLGILLLVREIDSRHLAVPVRYRLWHLFTAALFLPFFPWRQLSPQEFLFWIQNLLSQDSAASAVTHAAQNAAPNGSSDTVIRDFSTAVTASGIPLSHILWVIWAIGMAAVTLYFAGMLLRIHKMKKEAFLVTAESEPELYRQFSACVRELSLRQDVKLYASCDIQNPVSCGWLRPTIIIPQDLDIVSSAEELRFIFLHELQHCKHKDALLNLLVCVLETLYWFNPLIWYGFYQFRKDREIACDHAVLRLIGGGERMRYGLTILQFAQHAKSGVFASPLSGISSSAATTKQRITEIAEYRPVTALQRLKSAGIFLLIFLLLLGTSPLLSAYASGSPVFHLAEGAWKEADVAESFDGRDGSFVLYDMETDEYYIYNKEKSEKRISPASTFKIYSGLFALEKGLITPESSTQQWDGSAQPFSAWMQDHTLTSAMQDSVNWYFQNLDRQMGLASLASDYSRIGYGNCDLSSGVESYWSDSLAISPLEQVRLLSGLLRNQWDFAPENVQAIKNALLLSEDSVSGGRLYGKTGTIGSSGETSSGSSKTTGNGTSAGSDKTANGISADGSGQQMGWLVGFLETSETTYCFAVNLQGEGCDGSTAADVALQSLTTMLSQTE